MLNSKDNDPFQLVVGLGNPGKQYEKTRHNAGFLLLDRITEKVGVDFILNTKFGGAIGKIKIKDKLVYFLKPQLFMNNSGEPIFKIMSYYKIKPESVLVLHDDLDIDSGTIRLKRGGGHGGHNGLRDIHRVIGANYSRIRIGIGHPGDKTKVLSYVLGILNQAENLLFHEVFSAVTDNFSHIIEGNWENLMNRMHKTLDN